MQRFSPKIVGGEEQPSVPVTELAPRSFVSPATLQASILSLMSHDYLITVILFMQHQT